MKFVKISDPQQDIMHIWVEDACNEWFERAVLDMAKGFIKEHPSYSLTITERNYGEPRVDRKGAKAR